MSAPSIDALPPLVYAQASPLSVGGTSLFDAPAVVTANQASNFISEEHVIEEAASRLAGAGFQILQRSALTINIAGPPSLYEDIFNTNLVTEERPVIKPGAREDTATFIDTADTDVAGLIDTSQSPLADLLEGVAIEEPAYPFQNANPPAVNYWHLDVPEQLAGLLNADVAHQSGIRGAGVRLSMVDTGWFQHPYFVQRNLQGTVVLGPGTADPQNDDSGHGTGESANVFAVAPAVDFTMVKANLVNSTGSFNAAVNQTPPPQIVSNSWGYSVEDPPLSAIHQALAASVGLAVANGIVVVFAAGNGHFGFPAAHPDVIAAGGVFIDQNGDMQASNYASGFASRVFPGRNVPDVCGLVGMRPGAIYIALPIPGGCAIDRDLAGGTFPDGDETATTDGWAVFSGTSAACPQVAGICALLRTADPTLTPAAIRALLTRTSRDVTAGNASPSTGSPAAGPGFDLATGFGLADAAAAVAAATSAPAPAVAAWGPDRLDVFALGLDRAMYHTAWDGSGWQPGSGNWERLGGTFTSPPTVAAWGPDRLDVFALGLDRAMYHTAWDGSGWQPGSGNWERLGGTFTSPPTVAAWGPDRLDVFALGLDRAMYHTAWDGSGWQPGSGNWERLGGTFTSPPTVAAWGPDRLDVFALGLDRAMYHTAWDGSGWQPGSGNWERLGGTFTSPPTVAAWGPDRLDVFALGLDRAMYHTAWDGSGWQPGSGNWERLGGTFTSPPAVAAWGPDRLDVFALGLDRAMYHTAWDGSGWQPGSGNWERLGGTFTSPPTVAAWGPDRLDVFALGLDRAMYHTAWDGSGWQPGSGNWERLGGTFT